MFSYHFEDGFEVLDTLTYIPLSPIIKGRSYVVHTFDDPVKPRMDWPDQPLTHYFLPGFPPRGFLKMCVYGRDFRSEISVGLQHKLGYNLRECYEYEVMKRTKEIQDTADRFYGKIWRREIGRNYARPSQPLSHCLLPRVGDFIQGKIWMVVRGREFWRIVTYRNDQSVFGHYAKNQYSQDIERSCEEICRDADRAFGRDWVFEVGLGIYSKESCVKFNRQLA